MLKGRCRVVVSLYIISVIPFINAFYAKSSSKNKIPTKSNEPLFLTPFIESGKIEKARVLSECGELPNASPFLSYSGYFTVNKTYGSNIFFWFVPAMNGDKKAPVVLWLQGGPGNPGFFGFFLEHGPYVVHADMTTSEREYHWAKTFHMIYVDQPVGTGYSFTENENGYVNNQEEMAEDMYEFLQQFFTVFYEYRSNDFYITGESYAGKYVPSLAFKIHTIGMKSNISLRGIAIGNGMCDPESMMDYGTYLYNIGLVDRNQAKAMQNVSNLIVKHIQNKEFYEALVEMDKLIIQLNILPYVSLFKNFSGFDFYYNFLLSDSPEDFDYYNKYVKFPAFKEAIHVGNLPFQSGKQVQKHLLLDIMQSVKSKVSVILDNYRVLFYSGQLDIIIPYPLTLNFLDTLKWKYADELRTAKRKIWRLSDNKTIGGYVHNVKDFYSVLVRNAGHILPYDQPKVGFELISCFINGKCFD